MERTKRLVAIIAAGALLFGCGPSGPEAEPPDAVPSDNPDSTQPVEPVDPVEEVDYQGFTVAPPPPANDPGNEKESFEDKMDALVASAEVPSAFAGSFFRLGRAYLSGRDPITQIEVAAFEIFDRASPEVLDALERTIDAIDGMPAEDMARLYGEDFVYARPQDPLTHSILANAVAKEIKTYASISEFGVADIDELPLEEERAGLVREWTCPDIDGAYAGPCPNICTVETDALRAEGPIRTASFAPQVRGYEYTDREREQILTYDNSGNPVWINAQVGRCKGSAGDPGGNPVCLAVPYVLAGETIKLEGFNFHDVNAIVRLVPGFGAAIDLDAHVRGGAQSGLSRATRLSIGDIGSAGQATTGLGTSAKVASSATDPGTSCAVGDVIHFQLPENIVPAVYRIEVVVDNPNSDIPDRVLGSSSFGAPYIQVLSPPDSTRFQLTAEQLTAFGTSDGEWGSDEIGIMVTVIPVAADGTLGDMQHAEFEFGGVDSGDRRCIGDADASGQCLGHTVFTGTPGGGFGFAIDGFEIDNRKAYKEQITEWSELYAEISKSGWGIVSGAVGTAVGVVVGALSNKAIGTAVGALVTAGINRVVAGWAPADRVIQDAGGLSFIELDGLTSPLVRTPAPREYTTTEGVDVLVQPCQDTMDVDHPECTANAKGPGEYREARRYGVDRPENCPLSKGFCGPYDGGSLYQLAFRYNRVN